jgi:hypothetical protein
LTCTAFGALTSPNRSVVENFLLSAQHEEHR